MTTTTTHETWSSRMVFIFAAVGSSVGLANIWKFPYTAGANGGGAFVLIYIICILLVTIPIHMSELLIGRRGRLSPIASLTSIAKEMKVSAAWRYVGWNGIVLSIMVLSFYSVIAGWGLAYIPKLLSGDFASANAEVAQEIYYQHLSKPLALSFWHTVFIVLSMSIVALGLRQGVEKAFKIFTPLIFLILISLIIYAIFTGGFMQGARFLFSVDFSKITSTVVLSAVGQAFFTVGAGACAIAVYGAYLPAHVSIPKSSLIIVGLDSVVAIAAGLAIFPIVFANGLDPAAGPGLVFLTLPLAFGKVAGGTIVGTVFLLLLVIAAMTSTIAIVEPAVLYMIEKTGQPRSIATLTVGFAIWLLGLATVFSFNIWKNVYPLGFIDYFSEMTFFELMEFFSINIMLPGGGLCLAIFVGWKMTAASTREELMLSDGLVFKVWRMLVRYLVPLVIIVIMLANF
jgi:neurotransmitter:Na+ symporter, NSS family